VTFCAANHLNLFFSTSIDYEPQLLKYLNQYLCPGGVMFDVGANLGIYTLVAAYIVGHQGQVYSFEPDPQNNPWLQKNIGKNNLTNTHVFDVALASTYGETILYQDVTTHRTSSLVAGAWNPDSASTQRIMVKTIPLDHFVHQIERLDFIKIDVEGFEYEVLKGAQNLLSTFKPKLLIEVTYRNYLPVFELLSSMGYGFIDPWSGRSLGINNYVSNILCT
jgi:FkbM family methyltransferase